MEFVVTKEGVSRDEWIVESEPPDVFDDAVLEAIRQYRFAPGTRNGEPVEVWLTLPVSFDFDGQWPAGSPEAEDDQGPFNETISGAPPAKPGPDAKVGIEIVGADLQKIIPLIGRMTGKNFIVDDDVTGKVNIKSNGGVTIDELYKIFESVLDANGCIAVDSGSSIRITRK